MAAPKVYFFSEDISFNLKQKTKIRAWLNETVKAEGHRLKQLNFIFCSDRYLLSINQQYLNHDTYTDIVTFDNSENEDDIVGDVFVSIERVKENSSLYKVLETDELHRVMIHGTLHLLGYPDKGSEAKAVMTEKENTYLAKRNF